MVGVQSRKPRSALSYPRRELKSWRAGSSAFPAVFQCLWHSAVFHKAFDELSDGLAVDEEDTFLVAFLDAWGRCKAVERDGADSCLSGACNSSAEVQATELKLVLEPGRVGIGADFESGLVANVPEGEQAYRLGVRVGMRFLTVGGQPYTASRYHAARVGTESYEVTFAQVHGDDFGDIVDVMTLARVEFPQHVAELIGVLPAYRTTDAWADPAAAWKQVERNRMTSKSLLALDLQQVSTTCGARYAETARAWLPLPQCDFASLFSGASNYDLGSSHSLLALVCVARVSGYCVFSRRRSDPTRCVFNGNLGDLSAKKSSDLGWEEVPDVCQLHMLSPVLAFYESEVLAEQFCDKVEQLMEMGYDVKDVRRVLDHVDGDLNEANKWLLAVQSSLDCTADVSTIDYADSTDIDVSSDTDDVDQSAMLALMRNNSLVKRITALELTSAIDDRSFQTCIEHRISSARGTYFEAARSSLVAQYEALEGASPTFRCEMYVIGKDDEYDNNVSRTSIAQQYLNLGRPEVYECDKNVRRTSIAQKYLHLGRPEVHDESLLIEDFMPAWVYDLFFVSGEDC